MDAAAPLAGAAHAAQPAVCRRVRVWPQTDPQDPGREDHLPGRSARSVDGTVPRPPSRDMSPSSSTSRTSGRFANNAQAHGTERAAGPAREGSRAAARPRDLRALRAADDRPLSPAPRDRGTRLSMHGRVHPGRPHALPGRPRPRRRHRDQPAAAPDRHPARPGGRAHRPSRTRSTR